MIQVIPAAVKRGHGVGQADAFAEIERLREKIARLEERVRQLDGSPTRTC
jgi:hypothetical protein